MEDIHTFYYNDSGIAFKWMIDTACKDLNKIQIVFKNVGVLLSYNELKTLLNYIDNALKSVNFSNSCKGCKSILLDNPNSDTQFLVNYTEIINLKDLIEGTIFSLGLNQILEQHDINCK